MTELNESQRSAVLHEAGPLLIFAGAGSGKTRTITYRIAHLLANHRVPPYRILAVTFTNKAAGEMRQRLEQLTGPEIARDLWVGTFHGICAKLLRRYPEAAGLDRNFVIYDETDQKAVITRVIRDLRLDERRYSPKHVLSVISACKREGNDPAECDIGTGFDLDLARLGAEYQSALARANALDFDDLLLRVLRLVEDPDNPAGHELRRKFDHVLVDEFQDTNLVQYRIIVALGAATRNLCVVGDDDQAIYRWRGADVRIIRGFARDFPDARIVKLEQNYRSTGNIVRAALGVIELATNRAPKQLWTAAEPGPKVVVRACADERAEAAWVAASIARMRREGTNPGELAVFYRIHAQSRVLEEALRAEMIPYQVIGGMKFFERAEIKDLLAYLRFLENPHSDTDLLRIINVPARGIGAKTIDAILETSAENTSSAYAALSALLTSRRLGGAAHKKLQAFVDLIEELRVAKHELSPRELAERVLTATGYRQTLEEDDSPESDARLENLAELLGSIAEYEAEASQTGEEPTLAGYLERVSLIAAVDTMQDVPAVSLMSVHSAKGLEFDTVWLTGMEEETFPYRGLDGDDPEELDEERRLAYVAITRARKRLFVSHALCRTLFGKTRYLQRSRFLDDLPEDVVERQGDVQAALAPSYGRLAPAWRGRFSDGFLARSQRTTDGFGSTGRRPAQPERRLRPGERFVDHDAFDDVPDESSMGSDVIVRPGDRVRHSKFGEGIVERVETGDTPRVVARFPGFGSKRVLAQFLDFE